MRMAPSNDQIVPAVVSACGGTPIVMGVAQNGGFNSGNPVEMDDFGVPLILGRSVPGSLMIVIGYIPMRYFTGVLQNKKNRQG